MSLRVAKPPGGIISFWASREFGWADKAARSSAIGTIQRFRLSSTMSAFESQAAENRLLPMQRAAAMRRNDNGCAGSGNLKAARKGSTRGPCPSNRIWF